MAFLLSMLVTSVGKGQSRNACREGARRGCCFPSGHPFERRRRPVWRRSLVQAAATFDLETNASTLATDIKTRECIRVAIPSKGDIHKETLELLKSCGLEVDLRNPRQYMGGIKHFPDVELWFQRPADIVRKVKDGTLDIGVAGYDLVAEYNVSW